MTEEQTTEPTVEPELVESEEPEGTYIEAPKLMRIASMTRALLDEIRQSPLDEPGRRRLVEIHERSLEELQDVLSDDLKQELQDMFLPVSEEEASESELRIVQAQLVGWLEGLFAGIQATLWSQQAAAANQLQELRTKAIEAQSGSRPPGQYL
jgi:hypothetical protein